MNKQQTTTKRTFFDTPSGSQISSAKCGSVSASMDASHPHVLHLLFGDGRGLGYPKEVAYSIVGAYGGLVSRIIIGS